MFNKLLCSYPIFISNQRVFSLVYRMAKLATGHALFILIKNSSNIVLGIKSPEEAWCKGFVMFLCFFCCVLGCVCTSLPFLSWFIQYKTTNNHVNLSGKVKVHRLVFFQCLDNVLKVTHYSNCCKIFDSLFIFIRRFTIPLFTAVLMFCLGYKKKSNYYFTNSSLGVYIVVLYFLLLCHVQLCFGCRITIILCVSMSFNPSRAALGIIEHLTISNLVLGCLLSYLQFAVFSSLTRETISTKHANKAVLVVSTL